MADPITFGSSAVASVVNVTIKIIQFSYEVKAVDEKARDLLEMTNAVSKTLDIAQTLLHQKSHLFQNTERAWMDEVAFPTAIRALKKVAALVESSRLDIGCHGKVRYHTRFMYVVKESPHLMEALASLSLGNQLLSTAMGIICNRGGEQTSRFYDGSMTGIGASRKSPPMYAEIDFLTQHRRAQKRKGSSSTTEVLIDLNEEPDVDTVNRARTSSMVDLAPVFQSPSLTSVMDDTPQELQYSSRTISEVDPREAASIDIPAPKNGAHELESVSVTETEIAADTTPFGSAVSPYGLLQASQPPYSKPRAGRRSRIQAFCAMHSNKPIVSNNNSTTSLQ